MSTASVVPEIRGLDGDAARLVLRRTGWGRLLKDSFLRLRLADGFSHARSLAFMVSLIAIQGAIAVVGLATYLQKRDVTNTIVALIHQVVPGPTGRTFTSAVAQAHVVATEHHYTALIIGSIGALVTGTTAMGQIERGLNRIYGVEQDRPTLKKYALAFVFTLSVGALLSSAFVCLAFGRGLFHTGALGSV